MHTHPAIPLADSHPVAEPVRDLIDAIVVAARAGDDTAIRALSPAHPAAYCAIGWGCASSR